MGRIHYPLFLASFLVICFLSACSKREKKEENAIMPVPFLTGRTWIADTLTINPPMTYSLLSAADQQALRQANGWFKMAKLTLNDDATVIQYDYDFGYKTWRLINNNSDIEMSLYNGNKQILRNWVADANHFSYTNTFTLSGTTNFEFTLVYK